MFEESAYQKPTVGQKSMRDNSERRAEAGPCFQLHAGCHVMVLQTAQLKPTCKMETTQCERAFRGWLSHCKAPAIYPMYLKKFHNWCLSRANPHCARDVYHRLWCFPKVLVNILPAVLFLENRSRRTATEHSIRKNGESMGVLCVPECDREPVALKRKTTASYLES